MTERYIFHLAFPVSDLNTSKHFYVRILGANIGAKTRSGWTSYYGVTKLRYICGPTKCFPANGKANVTLG
jgi:extradiol dioxygenase family protein